MTGSDIRELERHARDFAANLSDTMDIVPSSADVLDALACAGLKLVPDEEGLSSAAYFTRFATSGRGHRVPA